jgi:hypothetical protein
MGEHLFPADLFPTTLHRMPRCFPFLEAAEERPRVRHPELSERERRPGARFLSRSTAVRNDWFA